MPIFELQSPDGKSFQVDAPDMQSASNSLKTHLGSSQPAPPSWSDVQSQAGANLVPSAKKFGEDLAQPFLHPITTGQNLGKAIAGGVEHLIPGEHLPEEKYADAIASFYKNRYGSMDALKKTLATDPVGAAADISVPFTLGTSALGDIGDVGRLGRIAKAASPVDVAVSTAGKTGSLAGKAADYVGSEALGLRTGAGSEAIRTAAKSGFEGGPGAEAFQSNLRGKEPLENVVSDAKSALDNIRKERGAEYRSGMGGISQDQTVLDFSPVDIDLQAVAGVKRFKGVSISDSTAAIGKKIMDKVNQWKALDPTQYHTAEGFDALKQSIGDIRDSSAYGTPERVVADAAYNAVKKQIVKQAPEYAKVMKDYSEASDQIKDIQQTFSLSDKAGIDTKLRKLQSVMRNNVNTNFGQRQKLAEVLMDAGAPHMMEKLAGQSLHSPVPRGINRMVASGEVGAALPVALLHHPAIAAAMMMDLGIQSPRLVGEAAYYGGKAAKHAQDLAKKIPTRGLLKGTYAGRSIEEPDLTTY